MMFVFYLVGLLTLYEFNLLPKQEQYEYIWDKCVYLAYRMESEVIRVNLYNSPGKDEFWIEQGRLAVWYDSERNEVHSLRSFKARHLLEPYLDQIKLDF